MPRKPTPRKPRKGDVKAAADRAEARAKGESPKIAKVDVDPAIVMADEIKAKMGRPTKYKPEYALVAAALCRRGATDFELAEEFEVDTSTIWRWSCKYEDFHKAVHIAKGMYDARVERALAQRATGYAVHVEKVFCFQGEITRARTVEHIPADVGAAKMWLTNRKGADWRDRTQVEHGNVGDFDQMTPEELDAYIEAEAAALIATKKSGRPKSSTQH